MGSCQCPPGAFLSSPCTVLLMCRLFLLANKNTYKIHTCILQLTLYQYMRDKETDGQTKQLYILVHASYMSCSYYWWLRSVRVMTLDLRLRGCGFDSQLGRYQVVTTWMGDCLQTGKPSRYITNHQCQLSVPSLQGR